MRRWVVRVKVSPEEAGLVACWQFAAVQRARIGMDPREVREAPSTEVGCYATTPTVAQMGKKEISEAVRRHWSAIENGGITAGT